MIVGHTPRTLGTFRYYLFTVLISDVNQDEHLDGF